MPSCILQAQQSRPAPPRIEFRNIRFSKLAFLEYRFCVLDATFRRSSEHYSSRFVARAALTTSRSDAPKPRLMKIYDFVFFEYRKWFTYPLLLFHSHHRKHSGTFWVSKLLSCWDRLASPRPHVVLVRAYSVLRVRAPGFKEIPSRETRMDASVITLFLGGSKL